MKHLYKNLSITGLALIGVVFIFTLVCVLTAGGPKETGLGALASSLMAFGIFGATGIVQDLTPRTLKYTHNAILVPGDPIVVNGALLIAINATAANVQNTFVYQGKVNLPKTAPLVINALDAVYWAAGASEINKTAGGNTACGFCAEAALSADTTVTIMLVPSVAIYTIAQASMNTITDPGNAGAIPVTASGTCPLTSAGAETRTLAAPTYLGQILSLIDDVYVGNIVVTCATTVNQANNNTMTFGASADAVLLVAMRVGGNLRWRIMGNDGVAVSTV